MIGIKAKVTLERTLYLDLPDDVSEEDILKEANKEVILSTNALYTSSNTCPTSRFTSAGALKYCVLLILFPIFSLPS